MRLEDAKMYLYGLTAFLKANYNMAPDDKKSELEVNINVSEAVRTVLDHLAELERENGILKIDNTIKKAKEFEKKKFGAPL
jgi:hypothetical protein